MFRETKLLPLQHTAIHCNTLQYTVRHCNTLQHTTTHYLHVSRDKAITTATHCNTLQHTATHCNTLQHTATHYLHVSRDKTITLDAKLNKDSIKRHQINIHIQILLIDDSALKLVP